MRNGNGHGRVDQTPAIRLTYQAAIKDTKPEPVVLFETGLARECEQSELDHLLDKFRSAIFRQKKLYELEGSEIDVANWEKQLASVTVERDQFLAAHEQKSKAYKDRGGRAEFGMNEGEKARLADYENSIARLVDAIKVRKDRAEVLRAECR